MGSLRPDTLVFRLPSPEDAATSVPVSPTTGAPVPFFAPASLDAFVSLGAPSATTLPFTPPFATAPFFEEEVPLFRAVLSADAATPRSASEGFAALAGSVETLTVASTAGGRCDVSPALARGGRGAGGREPRRGAIGVTTAQPSGKGAPEDVGCGVHTTGGCVGCADGGGCGKGAAEGGWLALGGGGA